MSITIKLRRGSAADWTTANPVLGDGEVGVESGPPKRVKIGDGVTAWAALSYLDDAVVTEIAARAAGDTTLTANTQTIDYTLALADAGKVIEVNAASARIVTIPPNAAVAFPVGTVVEIFRYGAGTVTVTPGAGVTIRSRGALLAIQNQYSSVALRKRGADEWALVGDLA